MPAKEQDITSTTAACQYSSGMLFDYIVPQTRIRHKLLETLRHAALPAIMYLEEPEYAEKDD